MKFSISSFFCLQRKPMVNFFKMRFIFFSLLMIFLGLFLVTIAISVDIFFNGTPGFGLKQLIFLIVGSFSILIGIRILPLQKKHDIFLLTFFILGILYIGLKPENYGLDHEYLSLSIHYFSISDFMINIFGFIPIGYLVMSLVGAGLKKPNNRMMVLFVVSSGLIFSLLLEVSQFFFLKSRVASVYDFIANGFGTLSGYYLYQIFRPFEIYIHNNIRRKLANRCKN